jgi:putative DNA methylase
MQWSYAETNPLAGAGGDLAGVATSVMEVVENLGIGCEGRVVQLNAANGSYPVAPVLLCSDPPYYDNVGYADLSDFFYVWARVTLKGIWPELLKTLLVPKAEELVATPYRHGGKDEAEAHFQSGMERAIANFRSSARDDLPIAIYYAFRQSEAHNDGISSTGWATFLQSLTDAQLVVDGTLPVRTEATNALKKGVNALASSIVLVCRKRPADAPVTTRAAFLAALRRELPAALHLLQAGNIAPVDLAQASIGPGMGIFTRYSKVLESDDSAMTVKTALQLINAALDDYLSEQESEYDAETRYAITWFETHGLEQGAYGEAETLAKARNVSVSGVRDSGLLESKAGKVRLKKRAVLPEDWHPDDDKTPTVWECAQHLIRVLEADGEDAAAALLAKLGSRADATRDLAYRLYQICERKKWAEEARAYNGLVVAWPELQKLAALRAAPGEQAPAQAALL